MLQIKDTTSRAQSIQNHYLAVLVALKQNILMDPKLSKVAVHVTLM